MSLSHHVRRMTGRDPHEAHRAATPLELLFDLTFVVAFSQISSQMAHYLELDQISTALVGFAFGTFAVTWAWINYSWLAEGAHLDNTVMVTGYVIMRLATVALWLRAARHDERRRRTCLAYAIGISIAQVGWIALIFLTLPVGITLVFTTLLMLLELACPLFAELRFGRTPWHAHHIAERYGLLVIITLGEVILGTILAISAVVSGGAGWTVEAALVAFGGTALAFGMWWMYFAIPFGAVLERHRGRAFVWGYLQIALFGSLIAVGAGLHVAANVISHEAHVDATFAILAIAIPVLAFETLLFALYGFLVMQFDWFHLVLYIGVILFLAAGVIAVSSGATLGVGIILVAVSPAFVVVGYETFGRRRAAGTLERATR